MVLFERSLPTWPSADRLETEGSLYHRLKNVTTECFRADAQWWSKVSAFAVVTLGILAIL